MQHTNTTLDLKGALCGRKGRRRDQEREGREVGIRKEGRKGKVGLGELAPLLLRGLTPPVKQKLLLIICHRC